MLSAVLMAVHVDPQSPTRAYYGTDTHVMGLMLGAALAFTWAATARGRARGGAPTGVGWPRRRSSRCSH